MRDRAGPLSARMLRALFVVLEVIVPWLLERGYQTFLTTVLDIGFTASNTVPQSDTRVDK